MSRSSSNSESSQSGSDDSSDSSQEQHAAVRKFSTFQAYLQHRSTGGDISNRIHEEQHSLRVEDYVRKIGLDRKWDISLVERDLLELNEQRLFTFRDLRDLSELSWSQLKLPLLLRDLLRKYAEQSHVDSNSCERPISMEEVSRSLPGPTTVAVPQYSESVSNNYHARCTVISDNGKKYEIDRFCPHKGADLSKATIENNILTCPKHHWKFDLAQDGRCFSKQATVNSREILNW